MELLTNLEKSMRKYLTPESDKDMIALLDMKNHLLYNISINNWRT